MDKTTAGCTALGMLVGGAATATGIGAGLAIPAGLFVAQGCAMTVEHHSSPLPTPKGGKNDQAVVASAEKKSRDGR